MQLDKFEADSKVLKENCGDLEFYLKQKSVDEGEKGREIQRLRD